MFQQKFGCKFHKFIPISCRNFFRWIS